VNRSSGAPEIDEAALDVAEHLSYFAARQNGQPVDATFLALFTFKIE
jgi:TonB family protein